MYSPGDAPVAASEMCVGHGVLDGSTYKKSESPRSSDSMTWCNSSGML